MCRLGRQTAVIAGQCHRAVGRAMIGAIARQDLVASCVEAGDLDRVLVGFRAAQREEGLLQITGCDLSQLLPQQPTRLGRHPGRGKGQPGSLVLDGLHHLRMLVSHVGVDQLGGKIQIALAIGIPEINPLRPGPSGSGSPVPGWTRRRKCIPC